MNLVFITAITKGNLNSREDSEHPITRLIECLLVKDCSDHHRFLKPIHDWVFIPPNGVNTSV